MHSVHSLPPCPFRCCADSVASLPKRPPKTNPDTPRDSLPHREDGCRLFAKGGERGHERRGEDEDEARDTLAALQNMFDVEPDVGALLYGEER